MDGNMQTSPQLGYPIDSDDTQYISGLSTILVATIQETKDRISQIEYIFCSQLFPNFQSKSKSLQKAYSEAMKIAEDEWKKKENDLLLQIEKQNLEMQNVLKENQSLKLEKEETSKWQEELVAKKKGLENKICELKLELMLKSKEVDEKQIKQREEKTEMLQAKVKCLEEKVDELQGKLRLKSEEVSKGKELQYNLLKSIEQQTTKITNNEQKANHLDDDKKQLSAKIKHAEEELKKKIEEVKVGRIRNLKNEEQLEEHQKEKKLLLSKLKDLEEKVNELQVERSGQVVEERESYGKLVQQIESKASELVVEKNKRRDVISAYKRLKSQYNFLCSKFGLTQENTPAPARSKIEEESDPLRQNQNQNPISPPDWIKVKTEMCSDDEKEVVEEKNTRLPIRVKSAPPPVGTKRPTNSFAPQAVKSAPPLAGTKRSASNWRETRSRQVKGAPDPNDDFLNTPLENIRENLNKVVKGQVSDMNVETSEDDETQDMGNVVAPPVLQKKEVVTSPKPVGGRDYKYVEPVRKKAERDNLKGFECKQCKKFYDAVLPDGGKDGDGNKKTPRCEHHDGVSRHRYRYVPPLTPEGFWNIGFDSEM